MRGSFVHCILAQKTQLYLNSKLIKTVLNYICTLVLFLGLEYNIKTHTFKKLKKPCVTEDDSRSEYPQNLVKLFVKT